MAIEQLEAAHSSFLSKSTISRIKIFWSIAKANGVVLSLNDIIVLNSLDMTKDELKSAWSSCELDKKYSISSGVMVSRNFQANRDEELDVQTENLERLARASSNISYARRFVALLLHDKWLKVAAISGSTSYLSVSREDDLDFFFVTNTGSMWISLVKSLLLARLFRLAEKNAPWLCMSCIVDEKYATKQFSTPQDALFARDAIAARVIKGEPHYVEILRRSGWMSSYFPKMYTARVSVANQETQPKEENPEPSIASKIANTFLYYTAGNYVRLKSNLLNRKFARQGERESLFYLKISRDHCIYESEGYLRLKKMYSGLKQS
ncbi:MAG: hypothetical protein ACREBS_00230 [Nitrososphaerales archaeon]